MNSHINRDDDLTVIKGIGPARQQKLRKLLDVHTFRDLAVLSVHEIEDRFKLEGQIISRAEIEAWIAQARKLADAAPIAREDDWKPFASFVVEFQTRNVEGQEERRTTAHYMEADKSTHWIGIDSEPVGGWMLEQLGQEPEETPKMLTAFNESQAKVEEEPVTRLEAESAADSPLAMEVTQIQAVQPSQSRVLDIVQGTNRPFLGIVRSGEPFALQLSFRLNQPPAVEIVEKPAFYSAQYHAYNLDTGDYIHLGDTTPASLSHDQSDYTAVLPNIILKSGMYRLQILLRLQNVRAIPANLETPVFQVV